MVIVLDLYLALIFVYLVVLTFLAAIAVVN